MSVYEIHTMKDPRIPFIVLPFRYPANHVQSPGNWHENVEVLCFTKGSGWVNSNESRIFVCAGDIVVINANYLHAISSVEPLDYYCLIVDRGFCLANHLDTNQIQFNTLVQDEQIFSLMKELACEFMDRSDDDPYCIPMIRAIVLRTLALLCRHHSRLEAIPQADSHLLSCIKHAIGALCSNIEKDWALDDMADLVGLSKYYFAREFHRITGHSFVSYIHIARCERAKAMLLDRQQSIGEIAHACGFSTQSYFTRIFKSVTGVLPSEYGIDRHK